MSKKFALFMVMGVVFAYSCDNDTVVVDGKCTTAEKKCVGQDFMACKDGAWEKKATCTEAQVCDINEASGCKAKAANDCTGQNPKCDGKKYLVCKNKTWHTEKTCGENEECDVSAESHCKPKVEDCTGQNPKCDGKKYLVCKSKTWHTEKTCGENEECDVSAESHCKPKVEDCTGQPPKCDGKKYLVCKSKTWHTEKTCGENEVCDLTSDTHCKLDDCTGKAPKCERNIYQVCENKVWKVKAVCNAYENCSTEAAGCKPKPCDNNSQSVCDTFQGQMYHYKCTDGFYMGVGCATGHACDPAIGCSNAIKCTNDADCKDTRAICISSACTIIKPQSVLNPETGNPPVSSSENGGVFKVRLTGKMREEAPLYLSAPGATVSDPNEKMTMKREGGDEVDPIDIMLKAGTEEVWFKITECDTRSINVSAELYDQTITHQINCSK